MLIRVIFLFILRSMAWSLVFSVAVRFLRFSCFVLLYESPRRKLVDGLPPVPNTGAVVASCRKKGSATIGIFHTENIKNNCRNQDMSTYLLIFLLISIKSFDVSILHSQETAEEEYIHFEISRKMRFQNVNFLDFHEAI